jgi:exopolysaccharide biosynthesis polyprenyl glycosylphosphotransferase
VARILHLNMIGIGSLLLLLLAWLSLLAWRGEFAERVLIVGAGPLANRLVALMSGRPWRHRIAAVVEDPGTGGDPFAAMLAGPLTRLGAIIDETRPDRIVIALADRRGRLPMADLLMARVSGVVIEDGAQCLERLTRKIAIEALTPGALIASRDFRKTHLDLACSRALSLVAAVAGLIALAPVFAIVAAAIKLDSPGPVLFIHDRAGLRGRRIRLLKFRTMRPATGPTSEWERDNGDRITRVGRRLRKYRLDELPQLINVLRGDLNLVGPRPHPISNVPLFSQQIPYYAVRALVRPGLTGWAQVRQGYANGLEEETEKMRYDLYYIKHMSIALDLRILFETIRTVVTGQTGARDAKPARRRLRWHLPFVARSAKAGRALHALRSTRMAGGV